MSLPPSDPEGFVLAGGKSSRMGQDKALIQLCGKPLIHHAAQILGGAGLKVRIAGARTDLSSFAEVVEDESQESGLGPLAGICSALAASQARRVVFLPVDLPLIPSGLLRYLLHHAEVTGSMATVVSVAGFIQTFPAVIDRAVLPKLEESLTSDDRNCLRAFRSACIESSSELAVLPLEMLVQPGRVRHPLGLHPSRWFANVNSSGDLRLAERSLGKAAAAPSSNLI